MADPKEALRKCREAGFAEGEGCHDVRAGNVELHTLTANTVIFISDQGTRLPLGDATDLWKSYQNGSIHPIDGDNP